MTGAGQTPDGDARTDPATPGSTPLPPEAETGGDDGALDSLGKAVTTPVRGAAEDEEPPADPKRPPNPPG